MLLVVWMLVVVLWIKLAIWDSCGTHLDSSGTYVGWGRFLVLWMPSFAQDARFVLWMLVFCSDARFLLWMLVFCSGCSFFLLGMLVFCFGCSSFLL